MAIEHRWLDGVSTEFGHLPSSQVTDGYRVKALGQLTDERLASEKKPPPVIIVGAK